MKDTSPITWLVSILAFTLFLLGLYVGLRRWVIQENFRLASSVTIEKFNVHQDSARTEQSDLPTTVRTYTCPAGSKYFIDKQGNSYCCEGTVRGLKCDGDIVCTMSPTKGGVQSCATLEFALANDMAAKVCPPSMPNYFRNFTTGYEGCTESAITTSRDGPTNESAPKCVIYKAGDQNQIKTDSCVNMRAMELMACVTPNCKKMITSLTDGKPAVIMQTYFAGESVPMPRMCSSRDSYERYLRATGKSVAGLNENPAICEVVTRLLKEGKTLDASCVAPSA